MTPVTLHGPSFFYIPGGGCTCESATQTNRTPPGGAMTASLIGAAFSVELTAQRQLAMPARNAHRYWLQPKSGNRVAVRDWPQPGKYGQYPKDGSTPGGAPEAPQRRPEGGRKKRCFEKRTLLAFSNDFCACRDTGSWRKTPVPVCVLATRTHANLYIGRRLDTPNSDTASSATGLPGSQALDRHREQSCSARTQTPEDIQPCLLPAPPRTY